MVDHPAAVETGLRGGYRDTGVKGGPQGIADLRQCVTVLANLLVEVPDNDHSLR